MRTAYQSPASDAQTPSTKHSSKSADQIAAKVGSEVITLQDLIVAIKEFCKEKNINPNQLPPEEKNKIAGGVLRNLIERSLLAQEAKHAIKDPKQYDQFLQVADKVWREEQLPPLQYQYAVDNEQALREKLREQGRSLEGMHQTFRQVFIAESFRHEKLKDKLKVELPDLLKYYSEQVGQHKFDRPAQITWREIVVEVAKYPSRDAANQKANALYEKLQRGADFAKLARAESDGPTSSREQGGLMQTSPGAYNVAVVNAALDALPIGKFSGILDGDNSFHIIKVEARRPAGPATFEEVQDPIRTILTEKKFHAESAAYISKLRQKAYITSIFDGTESDPNQELQ